MTLVKYKAYKSFGHDPRQEIFQQVNIYTLEADRVPVNSELVDYYDSHPNELILATFGENQRIIKIARDHRLGSVGDSHIVVPLSLSIKKYFNIQASELDLLQQEVQDEGSIWSGSINNSGVSYGGEVRAILKNTGEDALLHPVVENTYATAKQEEENNDPNTFTEYYSLPDKACTYWSCPIHMGDLKTNIPWHKQMVLLGQSLNHPWVTKMAKLRTLKRLSDFSNILSASIQLSDSVDLADAADSPPYYQQAD